LDHFLIVSDSESGFWAQKASGLEIEFRSCDLGAATQLLLARPAYLPHTAICFDSGQRAAARKLKDEHPDFTVLIGSPNFPSGEVLLVAERFFSCRPLINIVNGPR
jgi:hypothetical protein